ncbi:MAG: hypothetical protein WDW38_010189 [Sanguina aurantia]
MLPLFLRGKLAPLPGLFLAQALRALATRIVEIDRGNLTDWPGDYENYLRRREERLHAESQANSLFDKKLAQEEVWIRQGIKARRTRNEGRVRALKDLRNERAERRNLTGNAKMSLATGQASGKKVFDLQNVHQAFGGRVLIDEPAAGPRSCCSGASSLPTACCQQRKAAQQAAERGARRPIQTLRHHRSQHAGNAC